MIELIDIRSESSLKKCKLNHKSGKKQRRKSNKKLRDTFRRSEQPDERDDELENVHFSNFLGHKHGSVSYNDQIHPYTVRISDCDRALRPQSLPFEEEPPAQDEDEDLDDREEEFINPDAGDYSIPREEREYYMDWEYYAPTKTLTGRLRFKRISGEETKPADILTLEMPEEENY